jgi:ribosomal protein S18 acetylase RimI-like enzyme
MPNMSEFLPDHGMTVPPPPPLALGGDVAGDRLPPQVTEGHTIERAGIDDLEALTGFMEVVHAHTYPNNRGITREMFEGNVAFNLHLHDYLTERLTDPHDVLLLAKYGDEMLGQAVHGTVGLHVDPETPTEGHVWGFYINPELQGQGLGRKMWDALMQDGRLESLDVLTLTVAKSSKAAINFYHKQGFVDDDTVEWNWPHWTEEKLTNRYLTMHKNLRPKSS